MFERRLRDGKGVMEAWEENGREGMAKEVGCSAGRDQK